MTLNRIGLTILLMITLGAYAQRLPEHVNLQELGLSFDVPGGWSAYVEGEAVLMGHESIPGLIIMLPNQTTSMVELKQLAQQDIIDQGVQLQPAGDFKVVGHNRLEGYYQGSFNGESVKAFALALIDLKGKGVSIISLTTTSQFSQHQVSEANKLAASVKFFQAVDSEATTSWKQKITGKKLKYMHTSTSNDYSGGYSGISDRVSIILCADSGFYYSSSSQTSFDGSGGFGFTSGQGNKQGSYEIYSVGERSYLNLNFNDDNSKEFELSTNQQGNTLLNGTRYFVLETDVCS